MSNLTSKAWWAAAGTRAIKTAAQAAIGAIGASAAVIGQVNWEVVAGAAARRMVSWMRMSQRSMRYQRHVTSN